MQQRMYQTTIRDITELKEHLIDVWLSTSFAEFVLVDDFWLLLDVYHGSVAT